MKLLQAVAKTLSTSIVVLDVRRYAIRFTRHTNLFESPHESMFAEEEPRDNITNLAEWRARLIGHKAQANAEQYFYDALETLSEQVAVMQGLRATSRFGDKNIQARIVRAEDAVREAMELLHSVRPAEEEFIKPDAPVTPLEELPKVPALVVQDSLFCRDRLRTEVEERKA